MACGIAIIILQADESKTMISYREILVSVSNVEDHRFRTR